MATMSHTVKRALIALNSVAIALAAIVVLAKYLPGVLGSSTLAGGANILFSLVCVLIFLPLPFLAAFDSLGGFKDGPQKPGYFPSIANVLFVVLAGAAVYEAASKGRGMDGVEFLMLVLAPLAIANFVALIRDPKRDA